jgi:3'-phosphoadenosine 5'-phosphosulfate sulfotransferase (PAPS reductase)/FAD synthetase
MNYFEFCEGLDAGSIENTENNFILLDRLKKIRETITKYGAENFYVSFSGGKDSTVLSALIDMALPDNKIPRVYANTGIEYRMILDFVERERERSRITGS